MVNRAKQCTVSLLPCFLMISETSGGIRASPVQITKRLQSPLAQHDKKMRWKGGWVIPINFNHVSCQIYSTHSSPWEENTGWHQQQHWWRPPIASRLDYRHWIDRWRWGFLMELNGYVNPKIGDYLLKWVFLNMFVVWYMETIFRGAKKWERERERERERSWNLKQGCRREGVGKWTTCLGR